MCVQGTYGDEVLRPATAASRCFACSPNTFTLDQLDNTTATAGYTSGSDCFVRPGWGMPESSEAELCKVGFYNTGRNRLPCTPCPSGHTTLAEGASSLFACVVKPGW